VISKGLALALLLASCPALAYGTLVCCCKNGNPNPIPPSDTCTTDWWCDFPLDCTGWTGSDTLEVPTCHIGNEGCKTHDDTPNITLNSYWCVIQYDYINKGECVEYRARCVKTLLSSSTTHRKLCDTSQPTCSGNEVIPCSGGE
jgi:hypothetical protein